ncbi:MAG: toll/interleukin-1 receptor domain-containing protein [Chloroflexi bacterium]|nr:toll/interleukin-1 receptor domain-containing protein [Chloroflexota bacterium]
MPIEKLFISYSRKEFYFAESLATTLKTTHKLRVWFDIHELLAGADWAQGIAAGLNECDAVLLLASRAALESKYVRLEWEKALQQQKPVFVAYFEPVVLPPELQNAPAVDLRSGFTGGVARLVKGLATPDKPIDRAATGVRYPLALGVIIFTLLFPLAFLPVAWWLVPPLLLGTGWLLRGFLRRTYAHDSLANAFVILLLMGLFGVLFFLGPVELTLSTQIAAGLSLAAAGLGLLCHWLLANTADVLRWSPTGQAPPALRARVNGAARTPGKPEFKALGKTFNLHFAPADASVAQAVRSAMKKALYSEIPAEQNADYEMLIVSNYTSVDMAKKLEGLNEKLVVVVASAFAMPAEIEHLRKMQWIDFRPRDPQQLSNMAEDLFSQDSGTPNANYALKPVPENFANALLPPPLRNLTVAISLMGGLGALTALLAMWWALAARPEEWWKPTYDPVLLVVFSLSCVALLWLAEAIRSREAGWLPLALIGAPALYVVISISWQLLLFTSLAASVLLLAPLLALSLLGSLKALFDWLPPLAVRFGRSGTLEVVHVSHTRRNLLLLGLLGLLTVTSFFVAALISA